jgi:hypothetical protein
VETFELFATEEEEEEKEEGEEEEEKEEEEGEEEEATMNVCSQLALTGHKQKAKTMELAICCLLLLHITSN